MPFAIAVAPAWGWNAITATRLCAALAFIYSTGTLQYSWQPARGPTVSGPDPLLSLRAFACLLVLIGHGTVAVFPPNGAAGIVEKSGWFRWLMLSPQMGVWVFFVLSGYLMGKGFFVGRYTLDGDGIRSFYRNRLVKIAPIYWFTIISTATLTHFALTAATLPSFTASLLFMQQMDTPGALVGALWSIQTEMGFYLAAPLYFVGIAKLTKFVQPLKICAIALALGALYRIAFFALGGALDVHTFALSIYTPTIANSDLFVCGMALSWIAEAKRPLHGGFVLPMIALAACLAICSYLFSLLAFGNASQLQKAIQFVACPALTALAAGSFICAAETARPSPAFRILIQHTQWIGVLTFAAYVVHERVYIWIKGSLSGSSLYLTLSAISATFVVAAVFYWLIEKPTTVFRSRGIQQAVKSPA